MTRAMERDQALQSADEHGGLMDAIYRRQRHIYDATRKYFLLGRDRLIADLDAESRMSKPCDFHRNLLCYVGIVASLQEQSRELVAAN